MDYKLYTLVDITHTGQYKDEKGREKNRAQEQNFNTVLQTLGLRSNIVYKNGPQLLETNGKTVGFNIDQTVRVWKFEWSTEQDFLYETGGDPVGLLKHDFHLVPYIPGLNEYIEQQYAVFNALESEPNIVFFVKQ